MNTVFPDHYKVLGVQHDASADDIRKAYRALVKSHHPDIVGDDINASERFKAINEAHDVLIDPKQRASYDFELKLKLKLKGARRVDGRTSSSYSYEHTSKLDDNFDELLAKRQQKRNERFKRVFRTPITTLKEEWAKPASGGISGWAAVIGGGAAISELHTTMLSLVMTMPTAVATGVACYFVSKMAKALAIYPAVGASKLTDIVAEKTIQDKDIRSVTQYIAPALVDFGIAATAIIMATNNLAYDPIVDNMKPVLERFAFRL